METLNLWTNGNKRIGINLYPGVERPYFVMSSVWDGTKYQHHTVGKYKSVKAAERCIAEYISYSTFGVWGQEK